MRIEKHHIADILTLCKVICTCILGVLLVVNADPAAALIAFGIGELCDAFDGICARNWKYPLDGKYRWWREYASGIDKITDVLHLSVMALFFIFRICANFTVFRPWFAFLIALFIAVVCIAIQITVTSPKCKDTPRATYLILGRRVLYLVCIAFIVFAGIYSLNWLPLVKVVLVIILCFGAIGLLKLKWDRATHV